MYHSCTDDEVKATIKDSNLRVVIAFGMGINLSRCETGRSRSIYSGDRAVQDGMGNTLLSY